MRTKRDDERFDQAHQTAQEAETKFRLRSYDANYRDFSAFLQKASAGSQYEVPAMPAWVGVRVPFPFGGAAARVVFYERANPDNYVSSYLDVNDELGCMDCKPYFEIYPDESGDTFRFWATEQEKMYPVIVKALAERRRANRRAKPLPPSMGTESGGR